MAKGSLVKGTFDDGCLAKDCSVGDYQPRILWQRTPLQTIL